MLDIRAGSVVKSTYTEREWLLILMIDALDAQILHALQLSPRASFRKIGAIVGATEQTVARRYHGLRRDGVLRIVGVINPQVYGDAEWQARIRARPDRILQLADALARRPDIAYASILSGGSELVCIIRAPIAADREHIVLQQLPRAAAVLDISIDLVLHSFGQPATAPWTGYGNKLGTEQVRQLLSTSTSDAQTDPLIAPTAADRPLLDALAEDGRASYAHLAKRTGWSVARVTRRITALENSRSLFYDIDLLPERLGYHITAMIWLTATPQHLPHVGERLAAHDEIAYVGAISGRNNLMAIAICRDVEDLYRYLTKQLGAVDNVASYEVSIRRQLLKHSASVVALGRLINTARR